MKKSCMENLKIEREYGLVVEMSIEIIVLSFCQDSEEHQGLAQYAPPLLIETLGDHNEVQRLTQGPQ
ncbi:uncharacterized protein DS421_6g186460 [Arachis hypogaea]|nr:uncharacterized protein DS421_6g186460 [Arachis hypogaea]